MDYYLILEMVAVALIALIGFLNSFKKSIEEERKPIQDLNISAVKLNENFKHMLENDEVRNHRITKHGEEIEELKNRQGINAKILDLHETRIGKLEEKIK